MPMLYGEGEQKAFLRLQGEITKGNSDHTIFLWNVPEPREPIGMLTADLSNFCNATPCERCDRQTFLSPMLDIGYPKSLINRFKVLILYQARLLECI